MKLRTLMILAAVITAMLFVAAPSFSQEIPKPGTVIDKSNYKRFADLFPEEFLPAFENGFGGFMEPLSIKVIETKASPVPKAYQEISKVNKGKVTLDAQGYLVGYNYVGLPFPDLKKSDEDFTLKLMWNFAYKYLMDDQLQESRSFEKRRGEPIRTSHVWISFFCAINRLVEAPKPTMDTPVGLAHAMVVHFYKPETMKDTITLTYRYKDPRKDDDTYLYLPAMRRVIRAEAAQRSTPLLGSTQALDDFSGFDGRTQSFTYTLVGEKKVLAVLNSLMDLNYVKRFKDVLPFPNDKWEVRDVYVIDIKAKDPKYPQGRKRIYLDKENGYMVYYTVAWDRAGKLWKMWTYDWTKFPLPGGDSGETYSGNFGIDFQFGIASYIACNEKTNDNHFNYNDFTPVSLLKRAR